VHKNKAVPNSALDPIPYMLARLNLSVLAVTGTWYWPDFDYVLASPSANSSLQFFWANYQPLGPRNASFPVVPGLQYLDLWRCQVQAVSDDFLSNLPDLRYLELGGNGLVSTPKLQNVTLLAQIDLQRNAFSALPADLFAQTPELIYM
jgi:Leucine-rich repeat (LRR) protein